jgi:hypothetical protein
LLSASLRQTLVGEVQGGLKDFQILFQVCSKRVLSKLEGTAPMAKPAKHLYQFGPFSVDVAERVLVA